MYVSKKVHLWISFIATGITIFFTGRFLIEYNPFNSPVYIYWIDAVFICIPIFGAVYAFLKLPAVVAKYLSRK